MNLLSKYGPVFIAIVLIMEHPYYYGYIYTNLITSNFMSINNSQGSIWHRWDPHIHIPGTILNDQYTGSALLGNFCERIINAGPPIKVLGITDYYSIDSYEKMFSARNEGKLPSIELIFQILNSGLKSALPRTR